MPYFATSQEFLEQSSLLLEAYPEETRITTKYSYPKPKKQPTALPASTDPTVIATTTTTTATSTSTTTSASASTDTTASPYATLTLKTYHAPSGICLKYTTDKAAEIGRLINGLGTLAAGGRIEAAGVTGVGGEGRDGEVGDGEEGEGEEREVEGEVGDGQGQGQGQGRGVRKGGGKKKKGNR